MVVYDQQKEHRRRRTVTVKFSLKMLAERIYDLGEDVAFWSDGLTLGIATSTRLNIDSLMAL